MVLYWYNMDFLGNVLFEKAFRPVLESGGAGAVEYYAEYLETNRFPEEQEGPALLDFLRRKYAGREPDVVVTVGPRARELILRNRDELFPRAPVVTVGPERPTVAENTAGPGITGLVTQENHGETLELALRLHPQTEHVYVVSGTLEHDRKFEQLARNVLQDYHGRAPITYLTDLPPDTLLATLKTLPPRSVVLYVWQQALDPHGKLLETADIMAAIAPAPVPIYGLSDWNMGRGIIGGQLFQLEVNAVRAAEIVLQVISGARARDIPLQRAPTVPMFDWRQLQRWGIEESNLPPGSIVKFREPSLWDVYRWQITGAIAVCLIEAMLICGLLVQRARRRRAERSLRESTDRLQGILDTALEGILTVDEKGLIESANAAMESMFGYAASETLGQPVDLLISGTTGLRKDGSTFPIEVEVSEVVRPERRLHIYFVRDITLRTRVEQMDREFSRRLLAAQEAERARVARELHDDVTQRLACLTIDAARFDSPLDSSPQASTLRAVREELVHIIEDVHSLAYRLHPALLDHLGLARALKFECERFSGQHSMRADATIDSLPRDIPPDTALGLFRITQEALNNVSRHARAAAAAVTLKETSGGLELVVTDTGVGFDATRDPDKPSLGLASMRERVRLLGGELALDSEPGRGTRVRAWVPWTRSAPAS
jgi:signal transduction histidine kinase